MALTKFQARRVLEDLRVAYLQLPPGKKEVIRGEIVKLQAERAHQKGA